MYKWWEDPLLEIRLLPHPTDPLSFKFKLYDPDSSFVCAAGKGYLASHAKMHGLRVKNKENEVVDDIDYDVANIDINNDLVNFVLTEELTPENCTKVAKLRFTPFIVQTKINFTQVE